MNTMTVYLIVYLLGVATPILIVKNLIKNNDDGGSCLLNIILFGVASLIALIAWFGLTN
ncbi:MAG: hypothetical protein AB1607_12830 [Chloroflexota bacterium]